MEVKLLGPVGLWANHGEVPMRTPRQRCVLAVMAMTPGRVIATEKLIDRVWGDELPNDVRNVLYTHVSRVRAALKAIPAAEGSGVLRRCGGGYVLDIDPAAVDLHRVRRLVGEARTFVKKGREGLARAVQRLRAANEEWTGTSLGGVTGSWADLTRRGLDRERLVMCIEQFEAVLRLGQHAESIGPLTDLVGEHPMDEHASNLLMLALYRAGRQADALQVYADIRRRLIKEIGDEPGEALRSLHERILRRDPALGGLPDQAVAATVAAGPLGPPTITPPEVPDERTVMPVPAQLPAAAGVLVGRDQQLRRLDELACHDGRAPTAAIVVVDGMAGVGKTALALNWAHRWRHRYPDGQLFADLGGYAFHRPAETSQVLARFLNALSVPSARIPSDEESAAALYRSLTADRKMLILLDNAATADQVRPLLPASPECVVLVTSRHRLTGLVARDGARRMALDVLEPHDSVALLAELLGEARAAGQSEAVRDLASWCGNLPLALRVAGCNLMERANLSLSEYLRQPRYGDGLSILEIPDDPRSGVRASLELSYARLPAAAQRMFRMLGRSSHIDLCPRIAAGLAGSRPDEAQGVLEELFGRHLLTQPDGGRYRMHELVREYARQLAPV